MNEEERIQYAVFDTSAYSGEDLYSEGEAEEKLLSLVQNHPKEEYNRLIAESGSWNVLYHLSELRGNIVDFLPIRPTDHVLEVGSGCGAITGTLAEKAGHVTCIELSRKRSLINAFRNDIPNVTIRVGNFQDIEPGLTEQYDYILLIGVLEYAGAYLSGPDPYRNMLKKLRGHLTEHGQIVVAIENQYGIKYFAGAAEDHTGRLYDGIEGYPGGREVRTFSRQELDQLARDVSLSPFFMYPWPDYKLPVTIYSDRFLPGPGELTRSGFNFDADRFCAFDEAAAMNEAARSGMFPLLSNSFLVLLQNKTELRDGEERVIYSRHSNERSPELCIRTDISETADGSRIVRKYPMGKKAADHLQAMGVYYDRQKALYEGSGLKTNRCRVIRDEKGDLSCIEFEYLRGETLENLLKNAVMSGTEPERGWATTEIQHYTALLTELATEPFKITDDFKKVFGEVSLPAESASLPFSNVDLIFSNLMVEEGWNVIDYEWCFSFPVPVHYMIYRSLRYFLLSVPEQASGLEDLYSLSGIRPEEMPVFDGMERAFQNWVAGERFSLTRMDAIFGKNRVELERGMRLGNLVFRPDRVKIYVDLGEGFCEKDAWIRNVPVERGDAVRLETVIPAGCHAIRIDPAERPCILKILLLKLDGNPSRAKVNGVVAGERVVCYDTADPQILIENVEEGQKLELSYTIGALEERYRGVLGAALTSWKRMKRSFTQKLLDRNDEYTTI